MVMQDTDGNKRLHQRFPLEVPFVFGRDRRTHWSVTEDLSKGGMFLRSLSPPSLGEKLEIHLLDPMAAKPLVLRGKVVHRRERNKGALPGGRPAPEAGAGVSFYNASPILNERLDALLSIQGSLPPRESKLQSPVSGNDEGTQQNRESLQVLDDPGAIQRVFAGLCREMCPVRFKRLGGQISYTTFFREGRGSDDSFRLQAEAVALKDLDGVFSDKVPFVFHFEFEEHFYVFSLKVHPQEMKGNWSFPLPATIQYGPDRRLPRYAEAIKYPLTVEFPDSSDPGLRREKNALDISFGGLAFKNYPGDEVYWPGQSLREITICDFEHICRRTDAVVRQVTVTCSQDGGVFQKVGIEFANREPSIKEQAPSVKEGELEQISKAEAILQHLKKVAANKAKFLTSIEHRVLFSDGMIQVGQPEGKTELVVSSPLLSKNPESDFKEGLLSCHYLFRGTHHFFSTNAKRKGDTLHLEIPTVIHRAKRRKALRIRLKRKDGACLRCFHPVLGRTISFPVRDLSIRGLSFEADYERDLFWEGFQLRGCEIRLGDQYHPVGTTTIRSLVRGRTETGECDEHCGVEFLDLPLETERRISAFLLRENNPQIRTPTAERIESLWRLYEESGFTYPSKMAYIRKIKPEIDETWKKLLAEEVPFYKQIVFWEGEEALGSGSAVQVYEDTWMLQHLAARGHPSKLIPKHLTLGLAQFLMENRDIKHLITYFRKENPFPRKMYSGFLEYYPLEEQLQFTKHSYLSLDLEEHEKLRAKVRSCASPSSKGVPIDYATETDKEIAGRYFQKNLHPLLIRSRSLTPEALNLPEISAAFRDKGLKRERHCLVAKQGGQLVAFALLEDASQGINLSGLLNAFSLHTIYPDHPRAMDARRSLLEAVLGCYRSWQARVAIALAEEEDLSGYLEAGFKKEKEYICLTWSRRTMKSYYDYVQERFSRFEEMRQRGSTEPSS